MPQTSRPDISTINIPRWWLIGGSFLFLLIIFGLTTPFDFSWPQIVAAGENNFSIRESISRFQHGNLGRRIGMLILAAFAIYTLCKAENRFRFNIPAGLMLAFYLLWAQFSLVWSTDVLLTLRRVATADILWLAAIATAARYTLREQAWIAVLVTGATLALAIANELRLHTIDPVNELWRFAGLFHTVAMGWNLSILVLSAIFLVNGEKKKRLRFTLFVVIFAGFIFLILTKSRAPLAATLLSMGFYWHKVLSSTRKRLLALAPVIILCLVYLVIGDRLLDYGVTTSTMGRGELTQKSVTDFTGRLPLWIECINWAKERPILGYGFNTFINPKTIEQISRNIGWMPSSTHSAYMDALAGLGYVGAIAFISFLLTSLTRAYSLSRQYPEYIFVVAVLLWLIINLSMATGLIIRPTFMSFFCMTLLARLAFLPGPEWERT